MEITQLIYGYDLLKVILKLKCSTLIIRGAISINFMLYFICITQIDNLLRIRFLFYFFGTNNTIVRFSIVQSQNFLLKLECMSPMCTKKIYIQPFLEFISL